MQAISSATKGMPWDYASNDLIKVVDVIFLSIASRVLLLKRIPRLLDLFGDKAPPILYRKQQAQLVLEK